MITREQIEQLGQLIQNVNPDKHYWFFRTMGGQYYDESPSIESAYNSIDCDLPIISKASCL